MDLVSFQEEADLMFTTRLTTSVVSPVLTEDFIQVLASHRLEPRYRMVCERESNEKATYRNIIDWQEPVHVVGLMHAETLAAELRKFGGQWTVVEISEDLAAKPAGTVTE